MAFLISASRCLWASVTAARLYGRGSSVPKPGIHMFQFLSRCNCTSLVSTLAFFLCLARRQAAFTVFSTKSSAICSSNSSTSSSSCSMGSISRTSSWRRGLVRICNEMGGQWILRVSSQRWLPTCVVLSAEDFPEGLVPIGLFVLLLFCEGDAIGGVWARGCGIGWL